MVRPSDEQVVTWGDLRKAYKRLDSRIDEAFDEMHKGDDGLGEYYDQHEEKLERLRRQIKRLNDDYTGHTHEEEEDD